MRKKIVIIGATSTIAEHCARQWVKGNTIELILVGRDIRRLEVIAQDLKIRAPDTVITTMTTDFLDPICIQELVATISHAALPDIVLIAQGMLPDQQQCQTNLTKCKEALEINAISPVLFAEAFLGYMEKANAGTVAIISSVAGDRGRQSNYVYGAAKGLLNRYAQGLQHRFFNRKIKVVLIKPGLTATKMTAHLKNHKKTFAEPEQVATIIVNAIAKGLPVVYAPRKWRLIMLIIRHLPNIIFGKLRL